MKRLLLGVMVLVPAMIFGAVSTDATTTAKAKKKPAAAPISIELGRTDFMRYCAACHGVGARGDGTIAEFLTLKSADLTALAKKNGGIFPRERITSVIDGRAEVKVHGPRDMPVWGDWFLQEAKSSGVVTHNQEAVVNARIQSLVGYIGTLQDK